ncbi:membrane-anchored ubiquitin-fold protein 3-like isoform X2 [Papaver somniferum]|uniref:membrane-anchored ubiquitin-fold protein 3-like isoform X2 n=1 Tax=Papaver somniferum TaxID=3469 RepID=UPI000E6FBAB1|nr:membrane-anchored ubiquitin-fold protein 3-like isoform X2 [Papaver somniferum]
MVRILLIRITLLLLLLQLSRNVLLHNGLKSRELGGVKFMGSYSPGILICCIPTNTGYGSHTKKEISYGSLSLEDKTVIPKSVNDVKLIYAGKVLENTKTLAESRIPFGDLPGGVTTMHVVVQPSLARKKTDKNHDDIPNPKVCSCTIL